jgi:hypothetical protein
VDSSSSYPVQLDGLALDKATLDLITIYGLRNKPVPGTAVDQGDVEWNRDTKVGVWHLWNAISTPHSHSHAMGVKVKVTNLN